LPGIYKVTCTDVVTNGYNIIMNLYHSSPTNYWSHPVAIYTDAYYPVGVNVAEIHEDATASANLEKAFDGTGYGIQAASAATTVSLASGGITASTLAADAITAAKIADDSITTDQVADGTITAAKIAADAITSAKIADDSIGADQIANDAITASQVADDTITSAKIKDGAITDAKIVADVSANVKQVNGSTTGVQGFLNAIGTVVSAQCHTGSSSTSIVSDTSALSSTDDAYVRRNLTFTSGALANQTSVISDYVGSSKTFTVSVGYTGAPAENDTFIVT